MNIADGRVALCHLSDLLGGAAFLTERERPRQHVTGLGIDLGVPARGYGIIPKLKPQMSNKHACTRMTYVYDTAETLRACQGTHTETETSDGQQTRTDKDGVRTTRPSHYFCDAPCKSGQSGAAMLQPYDR